jgi:hypothetical protein
VNNSRPTVEFTRRIAEIARSAGISSLSGLDAFTNEPFVQCPPRSTAPSAAPPAAPGFTPILNLPAARRRGPQEK